jgi:hypothetical protein
MRLFRLLAFVMTAGLLSGALTWQAAEASLQRAGGQPAVGQCRQLTRAQIGQASNQTAPIACSTSHNSRVIAVPTLPKGVGWHELMSGGRVYGQAVSLCYPAFKATLGQTNAVRDRTAYTWLYFIPTDKQRAAGQRWIRCDLALSHSAQYAALPNDHVPALADSSPTAKVARCLHQVKNSLLTTSCSAPHSYRATGTFSVSRSRYPGKTTLLQMGRSRCPALVHSDSNFRWTWNNQTVWTRGRNHVVVCYTHTST